MDQNTCFSTYIFTNYLVPSIIQSKKKAFAVLDLKLALVVYEKNLFFSNYGETFAITPETKPQTKFLIVANMDSYSNQNDPALVLNKLNGFQSSLNILQQFELQRFNQANPLIQFEQPTTPTGIFVNDVFNLKSDINTNQALYNVTDANQLRGLVVIDRDGSLAGKIQTLVSQNLVRPELICSQNNNQQFSCISQIGVISINANSAGPRVPSQYCSGSYFDTPITLPDYLPF
ncbi:hypothetical protein ABPG72_006628 [Tetrahymena utriculariae]